MVAMFTRQHGTPARFTTSRHAAIFIYMNTRDGGAALPPSSASAPAAPARQWHGHITSAIYYEQIEKLQHRKNQRVSRGITAHWGVAAAASEEFTPPAPLKFTAAFTLRVQTIRSDAAFRTSAGQRHLHTSKHRRRAKR